MPTGVYLHQYEGLLEPGEALQYTTWSVMRRHLQNYNRGRAVQKWRVITTSWIVVKQTVDAKAVTLTKPKRVGPRLSHHRCLLHFKQQRFHGYAWMASTANAHTAYVLYATFENDIQGLPFCRFRMAPNHLPTQCHIASSQIRTIQFNKGETNLPTLPIRPRWTLPKGSLKYSSTWNSNLAPSTIQSGTAANNRLLAQQRSKTVTQTVASASTMQPGRRNGKERTN